MRTALITGAAGYLGSHVAKDLKRVGWKVIGLDIKHTDNRYLDVFYPFSVLDSDGLFHVFDQNKIDVVFHFAGLIDIAESTKVPIKYHITNSAGTLNVISMMMHHGVNNIVYSSTAGLYKSKNKQLVETDEVSPLNNPYAGSKYTAEIAIRQSGLNYVIFRYFNLAGADIECEFGENHHPETHLIPRIFQNLNNLKIYGNNYDTPDGTCVRDYVHVSDVSIAHLKAANYLMAGNKSVLMNLGTGKGHSVKEIVELAGKIMGKRIEPEIAERRPGDPDYLVSDINLAKEILNFQPNHEIISILETAHKWHNRSL